MRSCWLLPLAVWVSFVGVILCRRNTTFIVTAPQKPYYDTNFTVAVSAHRVYQTIGLSLTFRRLSNKDILGRKTLIFESDSVQTFNHVFSSSEMAATNEKTVYLDITDIHGKTWQMVFHLSKNTGYIFIQTDKPLYTPGQTVKFRVIALDEDQKLAQYPLKVDIKSPQSVVVEHLSYSPNDAFKGQEIDLPREATLGNWTITATYDDLGGVQNKIYSRTFEVREYVLPRFTTLVDVQPDIITDKRASIKITVTSKYISGQTFNGWAKFQLGIWNPTMDEKYVRFDGDYVKDAHQLQFGKAVLSFKASDVIPDCFIDNQRKHLFVNVTITEKSTMETDTVEDYSALIIKPHYNISFSGSKKHFKPGLYYALQAHVTNEIGQSTGQLYFDLDVILLGQENSRENIRHESYPVEADNNGDIYKDIQIPIDIRKMTVLLSWKYWNKEMLFGNELHLTADKSQDGQYLQVTLYPPFNSKEDIYGLLEYTRPTILSMITIVIMSRGHLLHSFNVRQEKNGETYFDIPSSLYTKTLPLMRIVAYYYHEKGKVFITDSMMLPVQEVCKEELRLSTSKTIMRPKSDLTFYAKGASEMKVGLVAVDKAVLALSNSQGLTRKSVFTQLMSHDQGSRNGNGIDHDTHMKNAGLVHITFDSDPMHHIRTLGFSTGKRSPSRPKVSHIPEDTDDGIIPESPTLPSHRKYFPETWLFEDHTIQPRKDKIKLKVKLPDSITTWSIMAVGVSRDGGVCVAKPIEQHVHKRFYAQIRFPYKVKRLEEVNVKVIIFNYHNSPINATVAISGSKDLCFSSNERTNKRENSTHFILPIDASSSSSRVIKIIPLRVGNPTIRLDAKSPTQVKRDIVERKMYVVAEGQKIRKTLTFVLDPRSKHAAFGKKRKKASTHIDTKTVKSVYNESTQLTKINLALPKEYIVGTESCNIAAFGDIMGDIISAILNFKSLMDHSWSDATEVIGDLGPTVHALLYANKTGLMSDELRLKGQKYIRHSIIRLLKYRDGSAFRLTTKSTNATWLTAITLKTLCRAAPLAFIDKESFLIPGLKWLLNQVDENGTLEEMDHGLEKDTLIYKIMLSAEALITILECDQIDNVTLDSSIETSIYYDSVYNLTVSVATYLEENLEEISDVMVLAKVTYALSLFGPEENSTLLAVKKLSSMMKENNEGQLYWANEAVTDENSQIPFWYHKGAKASSIQATAFALLVFLQRGENNTEAIADWLVTQRNDHGVFVGALDSMTAIQALSVYSAEKHENKIDMSGSLIAKKIDGFSHSFNFTEDNAIQPKTISNVPVGDEIEVITKGHGLGQMRVDVEYHVPVDINAKCRFTLKAQAKYTNRGLKEDIDETRYPLCVFCDANCPSTKIDTVKQSKGNQNKIPNGSVKKVKNSVGESSCYGSQLPMYRSMLSHTLNPSERSTSKNSKENIFSARAIICIQVCFEYLDDKLDEDNDIFIEVDLLSGYEPVEPDIIRLQDNVGVEDVIYDKEKDVVFVRYGELSNGTNCFTFRAIPIADAGRPPHAKVSLKESGNPGASCMVEYNIFKHKHLSLYCAKSSNKDQSRCRCFSGKCSRCKPRIEKDPETLSWHGIYNLVCQADIAYQINITASKQVGLWTEFVALLLSFNKTDISHQPEKLITLISPSFCHCPRGFHTREHSLYVLTKSANVERRVDKDGANVYRYLLDERSLFLNVESHTHTNEESKFLSIPYASLRFAFHKQHMCPK